MDSFRLAINILEKEQDKYSQRIDEFIEKGNDVRAGHMERCVRDLQKAINLLNAHKTPDELIPESKWEAKSNISKN